MVGGIWRAEGSSAEEAQSSMAGPQIESMIGLAEAVKARRAALGWSRTRAAMAGRMEIETYKRLEDARAVIEVPTLLTLALNMGCRVIFAFQELEPDKDYTDPRPRCRWCGLLLRDGRCAQCDVKGAFAAYIKPQGGL